MPHIRLYSWSVKPDLEAQQGKHALRIPNQCSNVLVQPWVKARPLMVWLFYLHEAIPE